MSPFHMFTRCSRWIHLLTICSGSWPFHKEILLLKKWSVLPSLHARFLSWWWEVAALEIASELQRSITMMQINKRHIKMRQKLINRFWRFWRACWGISMVDALLIAERVRYWTFSMTQEDKEVWSFKWSREG